MGSGLGQVVSCASGVTLRCRIPQAPMAGGGGGRREAGGGERAWGGSEALLFPRSRESSMPKSGVPVRQPALNPAAHFPPPQLVTSLITRQPGKSQPKKYG